MDHLAIPQNRVSHRAGTSVVVLSAQLATGRLQPEMSVSVRLQKLRTSRRKRFVNCSERIPSGSLSNIKGMLTEGTFGPQKIRQSSLLLKCCRKQTMPVIRFKNGSGPILRNWREDAISMRGRREGKRRRGAAPTLLLDFISRRRKTLGKTHTNCGLALQRNPNLPDRSVACPVFPSGTGQIMLAVRGLIIIDQHTKILSDSQGTILLRTQGLLQRDRTRISTIVPNPNPLLTHGFHPTDRLNIQLLELSFRA